MSCPQCNDTGYKPAKQGSVLCPNKCPIKKKPSTLLTTLVTIYTKSGAHTNIVTNFNITIRRTDRKADLILHTKELQFLGKGKQNITILVTRDPTPKVATGAVSLGFMRQRWFMKNAKLISRDPPTFRGKFGDYGTDVLLEMWDYDNV